MLPSHSPAIVCASLRRHLASSRVSCNLCRQLGILKRGGCCSTWHLTSCPSVSDVRHGQPAFSVSDAYYRIPVISVWWRIRESNSSDIRIASAATTHAVPFPKFLNWRHVRELNPSHRLERAAFSPIN